MDATKGLERSGDHFRPARVALGLGIFAGLAALGALTAGWLDRGASTLVDVARAMPAVLLVAALALLALDFLLGGLRLHLWLRELEPGMPYGIALRTYLVNLFAAAVTPLGAASGPAQVAVLVRGGVRPARAIAALLLNFVGVLSAFLLLGGVSALYLLASTDVGERLSGLQRAMLLGAATAAALLAVAVLNPRAGGALATRALSLGSRFPGRFGRLLGRLGAALERGVADYRAALETARSGWKLPLAVSLVASAVMLLNKCAIGFLVAAGLGFDGGYLEVAARQAPQLLLIYFSPSPGGSGIAEASVPVFLAGVVPEGRWMEFALLWRVLTSYVGVAVGALVAVAVFTSRRGPGRTSPRDP